MRKGDWIARTEGKAGERKKIRNVVENRGRLWWGRKLGGWEPRGDSLEYKIGCCCMKFGVIENKGEELM